MLDYVQCCVSRKRIYYRYRRGKVLVKLPADPSTPEFMEAYQRIHASFERKDSLDLVVPGSIAAMVADFKKSAEYAGFGKRTKELYAAHLDNIQKKFGRFPIKSMTRAVVLTFRDTYVDSPGKANNALKILSRLYSFGIDRGLAAVNPVLRVKKLKMGKHRPWTTDEVKTFLDIAPAHMRLALAIALYSGQRQSDIISLRWNQITPDGLTLRQQKTGTELYIPLHHKLKAALAGARALQAQQTTACVNVVATLSGQPYKRGYFGAEWKRTSRAAGLPEDCVFHGLRKTALVYLAEAGCTTKQMKAISGHTSDDMVAYYAEQANQKLLAKAAVRKLERKK